MIRKLLGWLARRRPRSTVLLAPIDDMIVRHAPKGPRGYARETEPARIGEIGVIHDIRCTHEGYTRCHHAAERPTLADRIAAFGHQGGRHALVSDRGGQRIGRQYVPPATYTGPPVGRRALELASEDTRPYRVRAKGTGTARMFDQSLISRFERTTRSKVPTS